MSISYNKLADQVDMVGNKFNGFDNIHDALLSVSPEYKTMSDLNQRLTSQYVWTILHDRSIGADTSSYECNSIYEQRISESELCCEGDVYYYELDPTTTDIRVSDEMDVELCVVNIKTMLESGVIDSPKTIDIQRGLVALGHLSEDDMLQVQQ